MQPAPGYARPQSSGGISDGSDSLNSYSVSHSQKLIVFAATPEFPLFTLGAWRDFLFDSADLQWIENERTCWNPSEPTWIAGIHMIGDWITTELKGRPKKRTATEFVCQPYSHPLLAAMK